MNRQLGLDILRGLSILYIVGFLHLLNYTDALPHYNNFVTFRVTMIVLGCFVFLSGYFVGLKNVHHNREKIKLFYYKRIVNIYIPYVLSIVLFTVIGLSGIVTSFKAVFAVSMFAQPAPPTLWFVSMLLVFYILSPIMGHLLQQQNGLIKFLFLYCLLLLLYRCLSLIVFRYNPLDVRVLVYMFPFIIGMSSAKNDIIYNKYLIYALSVITLLLSLYLNTDNKAQNLVTGIPLVSMAPIAFFIFFREINLKSNFTQKIVWFVSYSSYFMYLLHRPFYHVLLKIFFPKDSLGQLMYLVLFCLPVIIIFSYFLQKTYNLTTSMIMKKVS